MAEDSNINWPPLLHAVYEGDADQVREILGTSADVDTVDGLGRTALIQASAQGHDKVVQVLVSANADLTFAPSLDGRTALHWAAYYSHIRCCEILQASGADITQPDNDGRTAQELALMAGSEFILVPNESPVRLEDLVNLGTGDTSSLSV